MDGSTALDSEESLLQFVATHSEKLVANPQLQPVAVEQYRRLAAILHHAQKERGISRILVASALAEEGKTLTATNLALTLSESYRKRVLLIDADLRRPGVNIAFGIAKQAGLSEALAAEVPQKLSIIQLSPTLAVLPAGHPNQDPMHGLTSLRMSQILDEATEMFDWVIIDSPPVGILPDAKLLARMVDNVVFVIAAGKTPHGAIQRAVDALGRDRVLGRRAQPRGPEDGRAWRVSATTATTGTASEPTAGSPASFDACWGADEQRPGPPRARPPAGPARLRDGAHRQRRRAGGVAAARAETRGCCCLSRRASRRRC